PALVGDDPAEHGDQQRDGHQHSGEPDDQDSRTAALLGATPTSPRSRAGAGHRGSLAATASASTSTPGRNPNSPRGPRTVDLTRTTTDAPSSLMLIRAPSGATRRPRASAAPAPSSRAAARAVSRAASTTRTWGPANE